MGKKTRKTRWRTLPIADESDSEESNTLSGSQLSKSYHHRPFYSKFTYSSQSTPTKRFPYEPKSTRSSSTASETKITFNEDEYTKITTPRQDVLFKKGYLNKPKNYQTQTSTGNSTASTGNSTGNGTPDHQSADGTEGTDLEYESQFVFPNAFVDQNGIYYINSYEHYPLLMYNPTICYPEYPTSRTKRHSTGSLTESTSPHTEETSQDLSQSGGENTGNGPEFNPVYNVIYPGYYFNGVCNTHVTTNGQAATEPRKIKKKRRRKISKSVNQEGTSTSEDGYSTDEAITQVENRIHQNAKNTPISQNGSISTSETTVCLRLDETDTPEKLVEEEEEKKTAPEEKLERLKNETEDNKSETDENQLPLQNGCDTDIKIEEESSLSKESSVDNVTEVLASQINGDIITEETSAKDTVEINTAQEAAEAQPAKNVVPDPNNIDQTTTIPESLNKESVFNLNAAEFVPRAYRSADPIPVDPNLQFINIHSNFVPLPLIGHPELTQPPPFNASFLPPGIPLNFVPADPKLMPNFINFVPNHFVPTKPYDQRQSTVHAKPQDTKDQHEPEKSSVKSEIKTDGDENGVKEIVETQEEKKIEEVELLKAIPYKNDVDIAKIVSKLEEAAKEQKIYENRRNFRSPHKYNKTPRQRYNSPYDADGYKQNFDKRRPRRYDNKPNDINIDNRTKEVSMPKEETAERHEIVRSKSEEVQTDLHINKTEIAQMPPKSENAEHWKHSPRHQNYKSHASPRKYLNYNNRNIKGRPPEMSYPLPNSNYSETLKKTFNKSCPRFEKHAAENVNAIKPTTAKKVNQLNPESIKVITANRTSQWISVSNRKKRKNKSANEEEEEEIIDEMPSEIPEEILEVIKIPKIEEILIKEESPSSAQYEEAEKAFASNKVDSFIELVASKESSPLRMCSTIDIPVTQVVLQDVKDIEKELLKESINVEIDAEIPKDIPEIKHVVESLPPIPPKSSKDIPKKKSKKGSGKNTLKRIMIMDPDISEKEKHRKDKSKSKVETNPIAKEDKESEELVEKLSIKEAEIVEAPEALADVSSPNEGILEDTLSNQFEIAADNASTPDKKKSKKKKKQPKLSVTTSIPSASSSLTTLNNMEDSYDFLLDTTALVDEKTNIEVSEELDKMIQKGLFGNLEEKFKSLNVTVDDDFFKSLNLKPKVQSTPDKGFIKATNFTTILNNANQTLPKSKLSDDLTKIDIDFSKIKLPEYEPQPSTSKTGVFLEETILDVEEPGPKFQTEANLKTKSNGKLKNKSKKGVLSPENENNSKFEENEYQNLTKSCEITQKIEEINLESDVSKNDEVFNKKLPEKEEAGDSKIENENVAEKTDADDLFESNEDNKNIGQESNTIQTDKNIDELPIVNQISDEGTQNTLEDVIEQAEEMQPEALQLERSEEFDNSLLKNDFDHNEIEEHIVIKIENEDQLEDGVSNICDEKNVILGQNIVIEIDDCNESPLDLKTERSSKNFINPSEEQKPLYPITQAVRDWMTKTRETTPEIEILKSPDTIYKEFIGNSDYEDSDTETSQKNAIGNLTPVKYLDQNDISHNSNGGRVAKSESEDEITVFETWSMSEATSMQDDLLDCWESEILDDKNGETKMRKQSIEEGEDVLEAYESKYGKNEDFLRLKAEIEEQRRNGTFPKHGNLPYRAICCNLM